MSSSLYVPIQPAQAPDPNGFLFDLELQFLAMVRRQPTVSQWHRRFAWEPAQAFAELAVRFPIDLTSFGFKPWNGHFEFSEGTSTFMNLTIDAFSAGTHLDVRKLRNPLANEIIGWNSRAAALMGAWDRFDPPKIYDLLEAGEAALAANHPITDATSFFSTTHYYNRDHTEYGQFSNLIDNGGALAAAPIYAILEGGSFDMMKPWAILKGAGLGDAIRRAGPTTAAPSNGDPWIVKWGYESDSQLADQGMKVKLGVYAEKGYGLMFPHTVIRYEGTLDYAGLLSIVNNAGGRKDLNGYMQANQTRVSAILCQTVTQRSTILGILGRDITDTASTGVKIDERLKGVEVIVMDR